MAGTPQSALQNCSGKKHAPPQIACEGGRLISNLAHNDEHYVKLVTYIRIKNIVPPSSEPQ
jgi:hypothetical protein